MSLSKDAVFEIYELTLDAGRLAKGTQEQRKQADVLLARVANIKQTGLSTFEARKLFAEAYGDRVLGTAEQRRAKHEAAFRRLVMARNNMDKDAAGQEFRDMEAGTQSISYTAGSSGGYLVPNVFYNDVVTGMAQTDPLLSEDNVSLIKEPGYAMNGKSLPGYDLTTISATRTGENTSGTDSFPMASGELLSGYIYTLKMRGTIEIEADDFESVSKTMSRAYGVGFARGIGKDLVNGTGSSQPGGLLTGAADSGYITAGAGVLTDADINAIYFGVDRAYRNSPKCAWVVNDATYKLIRAAKDNNNRPLLSAERDGEVLMGKRVLVSPSMPSGSGSKGIVFGDLSHFYVRLSSMWFQKSLEAASGVEFGRCLYVGRMRADSVVFDPATLSSPANTIAAPIKYATLHS